MCIYKYQKYHELARLYFQSFDKCAIEITGKCDGEKVEYKMTFPEVSEAARSGSLPLHRLAAKNQIKLLEIEGDRLIFDCKCINIFTAKHLKKPIPQCQACFKDS